MKEAHRPDPEFVDSLEWELKSLMRRQTFFRTTSIVMRAVRSQFGAAVALAAVSMFIGGAGTYAAIRTTGGQAAALYVARGETLLEMAQAQFEHVARQRTRAHALVQQGAMTEHQLRLLESQLLQAESAVEIRKLELAETLITGNEPNDALSAPLVDGRDFVTERMAARQPPLKRRRDLVLDQARRAQEMVDAGVPPVGELSGARMEVASVEQELTDLEQRIVLRASFLAGELSATDVDLQGMRVAAVAARETAARRAHDLIQQHKRFAAMSERGVVSQAELRAVESELRIAQAHVELADLELCILDQKLEHAPDD